MSGDFWRNWDRRGTRVSGWRDTTFWSIVNTKPSFNLTEAGIIGKTDYDLFPAAQADLLQAHDEEVLQTRSPIEREDVVSVNGGLRNYLSLKFPLCNAAGKPYAVTRFRPTSPLVR